MTAGGAITAAILSWFKTRGGGSGLSSRLVGATDRWFQVRLVDLKSASQLPCQNHTLIASKCIWLSPSVGERLTFHPSGTDMLISKCETQDEGAAQAGSASKGNYMIRGLRQRQRREMIRSETLTNRWHIEQTAGVREISGANGGTITVAVMSLASSRYY